MAAGRAIRVPAAVALVLAGLAFLGPTWPAGALEPTDVITPRLTAYPIPQFGSDWPIGHAKGALTFLGGLELESDETEFGSLSGAVIGPDGRWVFVSDTGLVWQLRLLSTPSGTPKGVSDVVGRLILDETGSSFPAKDFSDAEAIALSPDGQHYVVAFETYHRLLLYPIGPDGRFAPGGQRVEMPDDTRRLRYSKGLEAVATAPTNTPLAGALVALAERPPRPSTEPDLSGWIVGGPRPGAFHIARDERFDATDAAFLPTGDLLLLERRIWLGDGPRLRIRRFASADIVPGARLQGTTLLTVSGRDAPVDNMEALVIETDPADPPGSHRLTLVSDNNRSILQRTLVLRFLLTLD